MRWPIDSEAFARQLRRHRLRFCCDDCAYFVVPSQRCAHGWPTADHRRERYETGEADDVVYCKEFELA